MKTALPFSIAARSVRAACPAALDAAKRRANAASSGFTRRFLARLRHDVDQVRLTAPDDVDAALDCCAEVLRIRDRARRAYSQALRQLREVDVRIPEPEPILRALEATAPHQRR